MAARFASLADGMRDRKVPAEKAAHFLMKLMFCMFAEDIGLLGTPENKVFKRILLSAKDQPVRLAEHLRPLLTISDLLRRRSLGNKSSGPPSSLQPDYQVLWQRSRFDGGWRRDPRREAFFELLEAAVQPQIF